MRLKQTLLFMAMILGLATLSSCSSSPSDVCSKALDAAIDGNYKKMASCFCFEDGTPLSSEDQEKFAKITSLDKEHDSAEEIEREKIVSYNILSEEINDDATEADVKTEITYGDGRTRTETNNLIKGTDGKWYIAGPSKRQFERMCDYYLD